MKKRIISVLILFAMLGPFLASCGKETTPVSEEPGTDAASASAGETAAVTELTCSVPPDTDLDGLTVSLLFSYDYDVMFQAGDEGDIVNDAIIARNFAVEEELNCTFAPTRHDDYYVDAIIRPQILAGDTSFNLYSGCQWILAPLVLENCFVNLLDTGLDFTSDWWAAAYIDEAAVGSGARFLCGGDISLSMLQWQSCMFFNKQVYADLFGDPSEMYTTVLDGGWTLDRLASMGKTVYSDLNGDGTADDGDRYSVGVHVGNLTDHFAFDSGFRITERGGDKVPVLVVGSEKNAEFTQKLYALYYENEGTHIFPPTVETRTTTLPGKLKNDELLFAPGWFHTTAYLRDMKGDFGLIPYPKLNDLQDRYLSLVHDTAPVYAIPLTCPGEEAQKLGYVLEMMAFLSWRDVAPVYYEVALKVKYVRDSDDAALKIVDMVHDGATTDFGYIYSYALDQIGTVMRTMMQNKSAAFASEWAKMESAVTAKFDSLIGLYQALE